MLKDPSILESANFRNDCGDSWADLFIDLLNDIEKTSGHYQLDCIKNKWTDYYKNYWKLYAKEMGLKK